MAALVDQADESELNPASRDQVDEWNNACFTIMGSPPAEEEEEPSEAQLAALHLRTWVLKCAPYTIFAIWRPLGWKFLKAQKFRVYYPLGDGSYIMRELPGPQNAQQWLTPWRVYKVACLMLSIASLASPDTYMLQDASLGRRVLERAGQAPCGSLDGSRFTPVAPAEQVALAHMPGSRSGRGAQGRAVRHQPKETIKPGQAPGQSQESASRERGVGRIEEEVLDIGRQAAQQCQR